MSTTEVVTNPVSGNSAEPMRAAQIIARCREIAAWTEIPGQTTRRFLSDPMHHVHELVSRWMQAAGMQTSIDPVGNLRGVFPAAKDAARRVILGSHLDTVPNAGAFDGILGVVLAIAAVESIDQPVPFAIEVIGFSEEEGIRFGKPFLGSLAAVGELDPATLALTDADGISITEAIRFFGLAPARIPEAKLSPDTAAYLEVHIEQGPTLEHLGERVPARFSAGPRPSVLGVVEAIVGQSRLALTFRGQANHAGTTPMHLRHDALAAASEWIVSVEQLARTRPGLVATVGQAKIDPGASNVIPGTVVATLDLRHAVDSERERAVSELLRSAQSAADRRGVHLVYEAMLDQPAVPMNARLVHWLETAVSRAGHNSIRMASGAGHDAMIIAPHIPATMLFVPSPGGLSHHPDETVNPPDVEAALDATLAFLHLLAADEAFADA